MRRPEIKPDFSWRRLDLPAGFPPTLIVVVDTEEEFDWNAPFDSNSRSTTNIIYQPLAQEIMDRYGVVPTYVVDYPVADTPAAVAILRAIAEDGRCEIGAHQHPWVCPPYEEPVDAFHSFPGNLVPALEREKLARLTKRIAAAFGARPLIYKAGRYGLGPATFATLQALGFGIDASVVPHTDFSDREGPDFTGFPAGPFQVGPELAALPLSVHFTGTLAAAGPALYPSLAAGPGAWLRLPGLAAKLGMLERLRLSPEGHSLADMKRQTHAALARGERYFMLTYHSSTLLPGATGYVRDEAARTAFLETLERYFRFFMGECGGQAKSVSAVSGQLLRCAGDDKVCHARKRTEFVQWPTGSKGGGSVGFSTAAPTARLAAQPSGWLPLGATEIHVAG
jgi:hypothetical protein